MARNSLSTLAVCLGTLGALLNASAPHAPALGLTTSSMVVAAQCCWALGNSLWLAYGLTTRQRPLALQFGAFLTISAWGLWSWGRGV